MSSDHETPTWSIEPGVVLDSMPAMFPGITTTSRGLLVCFATVADGLPGGSVGVVESLDGGRTWGEPRIVAAPRNSDEAAITQIGLRRLSDGALLLPFGRERIQGGYEVRQASHHFARSEDSGLTWTLSDDLDIDFAEPLTYGAIIEMEPSVVLCPVWGKQAAGERWRSSVIRSTDGGHTWDRNAITIGFDPEARLSGPYVTSALSTHDADGNPSFEHVADPNFRPHATVDGYNETAITELQDGTLLAILRQQGVGGDPELWFYRSVSEDRGLSWTSPERLALTGMSPALHLTKDGILLLAYRSFAPEGGEQAPGTFLAVSSDEGRNWQEVAALVDPKGYKWIGEYQTGYPDIAELEDGTLVIVFYSYDPELPHGPRYLAVNRLIPSKQNSPSLVEDTSP